MQYRRFEDLPVWNDAADFAQRIFDLASLDQFNRQPGLRDQLERAALSISNNIAEGFERGSTKELLAFLYIARGSAGEVRSMLKVLNRGSRYGNLKSQISDLIMDSEKISKQLYRWIESLKNSEISGQRHLDDKARTAYGDKKDRQYFLDELDRINQSEAHKRQSAKKSDQES